MAAERSQARAGLTYSKKLDLSRALAVLDIVCKLNVWSIITNFVPSTHSSVQITEDGLSQVWGQAVPHSMYTFPAAEQLAGSGLGFLVGLDSSSSVDSGGQSEGSTHLFLNLTMPAGQKQPVKEGRHPL